MVSSIQKTEVAAIAEAALIGGDLRQMSSEQRVQYYLQTCESVGLNPYSKPFEYLQLNGKLILYPRKEAANQLAKKHGISFGEPKIQFEGNLIIVSITARDRTGRTDSDVGIVATGNDKANAIMKAVTKAKRRVTFSMVGLSFDVEEYEPGKSNAEIIPAEIAESLPTLTPDPIENHPEFNTRIRKIREALNVDSQLILNWLKARGAEQPRYLSQQQCDNLVIAIATHKFPNQDVAIESYQRFVPEEIARGKSEIDAIVDWVQFFEDHQSNFEIDA